MTTQHLEPLMQRNFLEYASYVIVDRAIPDIRDGCKPVQRRILHTLFAAEDGKFHKVANIIGEAMKLHPHGDVSIGDALVVLANKDYFIEKQGNYGNVVTGHQAAASRYIECRLTPLALETLFNKALTETQLSYDGRREEPVFLPAKLPVILMLGTEGIAVGMATKILPHNLIELLEAQIACLEGEVVTLYPDFLHGGSMDVSEYADGQGKVKVRATLEPVGDKKVVVREIPYGTTTESLIASIEGAIQKGKVKITSINDFTTDKVEIELMLARGTYADEVIPQLYAYTDCEVSISSNLVVIQGRHPVELRVGEVLKILTERLRAQIKLELELELKTLGDKEHWLTLEQVFIEHRLYKQLESATSADEVAATVVRAMRPFHSQLNRPMSAADVERLLEIRIRRISAYDLDKNRKDIEKVQVALKQGQTRLKNLTKTTVAYLRDLIKRYGKSYPRRTRVARFKAIDRRAVANQNIKLSYDTKTGFFGSEVRGDAHQMTVSEYDLILAVSQSGSYRVMSAQPKVLLGKVMLLIPFDPKVGQGLFVVYRDSKRMAFAKRVQIEKAMRNREYRLFSDKTGKIDYVAPPAAKGGIAKFSYVPTPRGRITEGKFALQTLEVVSNTNKGTKLAPKPVSRIRVDKT